MNAGMYSSEIATWETPPDLFAYYDRRFRFTLDVCALPENAKCARYFTPEQDGLKQSWQGEWCWCNPPYGRAIGAWVEKAAKEAAPCAALLPARTDTRWWHEWVAPFAGIEFLKGRVSFVGGSSAAPFPSAVALYGLGFANRAWFIDWKEPTNGQREYLRAQVV
jgi:phage N-6-adenine-methyltransferase